MPFCSKGAKYTWYISILVKNASFLRINLMQLIRIRRVREESPLYYDTKIHWRDISWQGRITETVPLLFYRVTMLSSCHSEEELYRFNELGSDGEKFTAFYVCTEQRRWPWLKFARTPVATAAATAVSNFQWYSTRLIYWNAALLAVVRLMVCFSPSARSSKWTWCYNNI